MEHEVVRIEQSLPEIEILLARNDILDAFSDLESKTCSFLKLANQKHKGIHFGAKLEAFKSVEGISQIAKANYGTRDKLVEEIAAILPIRADIVHSRMKICMIDDVAAAIFVNSANQCEPFPPARILTHAEMRRIAATILRIVDDLGKLGRVVNPASSPLPPSPGAAGGP